MLPAMLHFRQETSYHPLWLITKIILMWWCELLLLFPQVLPYWPEYKTTPSFSRLKFEKRLLTSPQLPVNLADLWPTFLQIVATFLHFLLSLLLFSSLFFLTAIFYFSSSCYRYFYFSSSWQGFALAWGVKFSIRFKDIWRHLALWMGITSRPRM